jgi:hypothetical protein
MAPPTTVLLVHVISPSKTRGVDLIAALDDIERNHRLLAGQGNWGYGVYAYFAGQVPTGHRSSPLVVFECEASIITAAGPTYNRFAFIRTPIGAVELRIDFRGVLNVPAGYTEYRGPDPFRS